MGATRLCSTALEQRRRALTLISGRNRTALYRRFRKWKLTDPAVQSLTSEQIEEVRLGMKMEMSLKTHLEKGEVERELARIADL